VVPALELPTEVRRLFEAEVERDFFYGIFGEQQSFRYQKSTLVQPALGCASKSKTKVSLTYFLQDRKLKFHKKAGSLLK